MTTSQERNPPRHPSGTDSRHNPQQDYKEARTTTATPEARKPPKKKATGETKKTPATSTATPKKNRNSQEERRANTRHLQKERTTNKGDSKGTTRVHQTPLDSLTHKENLPNNFPKTSPKNPQGGPPKNPHNPMISKKIPYNFYIINSPC